MAFGIQVNAGGYFIHDSNIYAEDLRSIKSVYVAIADFSDGSFWGELMIYYQFNSNGKLTFEVIDHFLYPKN